jgi:hypothetical protein
LIKLLNLFTAAAVAAAPINITFCPPEGGKRPPSAKPSRTSNTTATNQKSSKGQKFILPPKAPQNARENSESVVAFVAVGALFLSGVLFLIPALLGGAPATTKPLMKGVEKAIGIENRPSISAYNPGPGPAAAPGTAATLE